MLELGEKVKQIKNRRKELGLTQKDLSKKSGVSQSFIAKLESGNYEPSYSKLKKVEDALERLSKKTRAKEIMTQPVMAVQQNETVRKAAKLMEKNDFSQLPVKKDGELIGIVYSKDLMTVAADKNIEEVMRYNVPVVSDNTSIDAVVGLLKETDAVLVKDETGEVNGIITPSDLL